MREGITGWRAIRVLLAGLVLGRCPACGRCSMFRSAFELHARCPDCGSPHEVGDGAWLGGVAIGYAFGALFAVAVTIIELRWHPIAGLGLQPTWAIALASIVVTALAYRPAKGLWFSLLYLYGLAGESP